ncbi:MAG: helix-turn-helix domain-containing protein, partial [Candidatus Omnitrophica bacterium]|nr:helix-turn-helix domain-containing protein [Candidatus Omnitrophota bacterium]
KGVYNYIKEEPDPVTQQPMPRKYFSGGVQLLDLAMTTHPVMEYTQVLPVKGSDAIRIVVDIKMSSAELSPEDTIRVRDFILKKLRNSYPWVKDTESLESYAGWGVAKALTEYSEEKATSSLEAFVRVRGLFRAKDEMIKDSVIHETKTKYKKETARNFEVDKDGQSEVNYIPASDNLEEKVQIQMDVEDKLKLLSPAAFFIIHQYFYQNKPMIEIAQEIHLSEASVSNRIKKILEGLQYNKPVDSDFILKPESGFGEIIKKIKKNLLMTDEDLANELKVKDVFINELEKEKRFPTYNQLYRLAELSGVPLTDLFRKNVSKTEDRIHVNHIILESEGLKDLARDLEMDVKSITSDLIHTLPLRFWRAVQYYYGIDVKKASNAAEVLTNMKAEGYSYNDVSSVRKAREYAFVILRQRISGRQRLAQKIDLDVELITDDKLQQIPEILREVLQMIYGIGKHRITENEDVAAYLETLGYTSPVTGKAYSRKWITRYKVKAENFLRLYLLLGIQSEIGQYQDGPPLKSRRQLRTGWKKEEGDGLDRLNKDIGGKMTTERWNMLLDYQIELLKLYYGIGRKPAANHTEISEEMFKKGFRSSVKKDQPYGETYLNKLRANLVEFLRKTPNGISWLSKDVGIPVEELKKRIGHLSKLEWKILKMSNGIGEPCKATKQEILDELKVRDIRNPEGEFLKDEPALNRVKINAIKRLKGEMRASKNPIGETWQVEDKAMSGQSETGGIDLTSEEFLDVKNSGEEMSWHMDKAMLEEFQKAKGFEPVIVDMQKLEDLGSFLQKF